MDFIREYQSLIIAFIAAITSGLGFFYRLLAARQHDYEQRTNETLDDHEQRIRQSVDKTEYNLLVSEVRGLKEEMHTAVTQSCAHNTQTRVELHAAVIESERRLVDKIESVFNRLDERRG